MPDRVVIVGQEQVGKVQPNGSVGDVVVVTFTVDADGPFRVDVPVDSYEPDTVRALVENVAARARAARKAVG